MTVDQIQVLSDARKQNFYVVKLINREDPGFEGFVFAFNTEVFPNRLPGGQNAPLFTPQNQYREIRQRQALRQQTRQNIIDHEAHLKLKNP